ncbi:tetratricopeptide repeat protein [Streptomyces sp. NPDC021098]|uniref:tetratricopeptide repeat protein n=1 Tax=unclassified Streptomyces TaxID=2593676 RepID=UPI0037A44E50
MRDDRSTTENHLSAHAHVGVSVQARTIRTIHVHETHLPPPPPRQLRPVPPHFTDRLDDLHTLTRHLNATSSPAVRIVVIYGAGGVGKTALATRLLHEVADQFPGGHLHADLRGYTPQGPARIADVLGRLLRSFRHGPLPADTDELADWWRSTTAERGEHEGPVAVLLDNAVHEQQVRALLPGGAGHLVVVTSRHPLPDLVHEDAAFHPLGPLPEAASRELLVRYIGADRVGREHHSVQHLTALARGLPLALTVAAAQLAASPARSIADVVTAVSGSRRQALTQHHRDDYDSGRIAVTSALEPAYFGLGPETARVYRCMGSLFGTDFDTHLTAAACALTLSQAAEALTNLVSARFLEHRGRGGVRGDVYGFHDDILAHALYRAQLENTEAEDTETRRRAIDWLLTTATAAERRLAPTHRVLARDILFEPAIPAPFNDDPSALIWLDAEHANLMAAVRTAYDAELYGPAWQLVHAMWPWWHRYHHYDAWFEAHKIAYDAAEQTHDTTAQREILGALGVGLRSAGRHHDAITAFHQVLDMAQRAADLRAESQALHELGSTHQADGHPTKAQPFLHRARDLRTTIRYPRGVALTDICLGQVAYDTGDPTEALAYFTAARNTLLNENDPFDAARALAWKGRCHARLGDFPAANRMLRRAHREFHSAESPRWIARTLEMRGQIAEEQGHLQEARRLYTQAMQQYEQINPRDVKRLRGRLQQVQAVSG